MKKRHMDFEAGFTLVELALVFVVVALLLGGLLVPLSMQIEQQKIRETQKAMEEIKEALFGYVLTNSHLPCPDKMTGAANGANDTPNDGFEDFNATTGVCIVDDGNVPWTTLGTAAGDAWGQHFRYRVTADFSNRAPASTFILTSAGNIMVRARGDDPATVGTVEKKSLVVVASGVPAIVVSHGKNGRGAVSVSGIAQPLPINSPPDMVDEAENSNGDASFVVRAYVEPSSGCSDSDETKTFCEFDDLVIWLSPNILFNRMVAAGRLP